MSHRRFVHYFIFLSAIPFILLFAFNYIVDPLQFYRPASFYEPYYSMQQRYQNPGLARNFTYNTIIIGTSMSENFVPSHVENTLGQETVKLTMSAATAREQKLMASLAISTGKAKHVFWEVNFDSINVPADRVQEQFGDFPYHLYDNNPFSDINYILSRDTTDLSLDIIRALRGKMELPKRDPDRLNNWNNLFTYGRAEVVKSWEERDKSVFSMDPEAYAQMAKDNIDHNFTAVVSRHPDVEFSFYFPPFSVLKHRSYYDRNLVLFEHNLQMKRYFVETLGRFPNVRIFDFQYLSHITFNLDLYKDLSHYKEEVNEYMVEAFKKGDYLVTQNTVDENLSILRGQVENLDVETLFR